MSRMVDRRPKVPGHGVGTLSIGPVRRAWCTCGWRWEQPDPAMLLAAARRLEREAIQVHQVLASPPTVLPGEDWVREKNG